MLYFSFPLSGLFCGWRSKVLSLASWGGRLVLTGLQDHEHVDGRLLSCGRPCPGIDIQIVDPSGKPVDTGKPGEVVARGANVVRVTGTIKDTELAFHNGMFRTVDIGYQDSDSHCYILNPLKDMIVTGGENVYSGEVEAVISKHPAVQEGRSSEYLLPSGSSSWRLALCY